MNLRGFVFLFILAVSFAGKKAKDIIPVTEKFYPCIHYEFNEIEPSTEEGLNAFFNRLDSYLHKRQGKINIVHIGDSHVQADYLCHASRKLFQQSFGNGGRGFVFPHKIAKTNNAYTVAVQSLGNWFSNKSITASDNGNYGIAGLSISTYDTAAALMINPNKIGDMNYEFSRLKLFYQEEEFGFGIKFSDGSLRGIDYDEIPLKSGISQVYFQKPIDSVWISFEKSYFVQKEFQLYGMSLENDYPGIIYHGVGLNGAFAKSMLRDQYFEPQLKALNADLVIVSLGTNDGFVSSKNFCVNCFKDSYRTLLERIRQNAPGASILITTPGDNFIRAKYHNVNVRLITEALYEVAAEFNAALWDFNKIMGGDYSMRSWQSYGLAQRDLVHFTEDGYNVIGTMMYQAIMRSYECRFDR